MKNPADFNNYEIVSSALVGGLLVIVILQEQQIRQIKVIKNRSVRVNKILVRMLMKVVDDMDLSDPMLPEIHAILQEEIAFDEIVKNI